MTQKPYASKPLKDEKAARSDLRLRIEVGIRSVHVRGRATTERKRPFILHKSDALARVRAHALAGGCIAIYV
jgi:hypothetical protein